MQPGVGLGDPGQLLPLPIGQVLGVLPQRVASVFESAGIAGGDADAVSVALGLPGSAGVVPGLTTDLVESVGGPLDDVERVGALDRVRAPFGDDLGDPVGLISRHLSECGAAVWPELVEEAAQGGAIPARRGPHQPAGVVIDHDGE